ncbi:DUF2787 family protein [Geobacter anodireducens]|uniref:DUF2787 domain-containing protein n=1 Tax=Geobacter soli TaxID=1510391 RepID=A0A0C1U405_9BACT|nr:DUF2787 family protein [Geobacter soli]KIE42485.1 hypothetical protein SE37_07490 [Geobacter soli]
MTINTDTLPWQLSIRLLRILEQELASSALTPAKGVIISFRDHDYSQEKGGFHPVEIAIAPDGRLLYVTDFAYVGRPPHEELAKEIDFDFRLGLFQHFGREYPIVSGRELFRLWQRNFITYYGMGVYSVSIESLTGG